MHPILFNESFFFCPRDDLERLQPVSQSLLDIIVACSNVLPLRPIQRVHMGYGSEDKIRIFVEEPAASVVPEPDYEASIDDGDLAEAFRRLQHTCIKEFNVGVRDSPFLRDWIAQEAAAFTVVRIDFSLTDDTDYSVLDSIVNRIRPRTMGDQVEVSSLYLNGFNDRYLGLLTRDSFLNSLRTCRLHVDENSYRPLAVVLNEPGYPNYVVRCNYGNAPVRIDDFIESFIREGCANRRLESVWVRWVEEDDGPHSHALKRFSKPTKVDMPMPDNDMTAWLDPACHPVSQCEMHSFTDKKYRKQMEVYKWSNEFERPHGRFSTHIIQCRVKNL